MPKKEELTPVTPEVVQISKAEWESVQAQLKMLYEVADKGRVYNYENARADKKPMRVKLSKYQEGIIVGWRVIKDQNIYHPTTGKQVGEVQEFELLIDKDGKIEKVQISGYQTFSEARYAERVECEVTGKKEDLNGNFTFDVKLPDGRILALDARFIN